MAYVRIGLRRGGRFLQTIFCWCKYLFSPFRLFLPLRRCPFLMRGLLRKSRTPGLPLLLPPSLQKGGMRGGGEVSGCPCVASRGSSSPPAQLLSSERGGGALGRSFGARELASVSSVHSWTGGPGFALLRQTPSTRSVRLALPPHLCTPCEVMVREGLRGLTLFSVAYPASSLHALRGDEAGRGFGVPLQLGFLPGFPIFGLGSKEGALSPLLVGWLS